MLKKSRASFFSLVEKSLKEIISVSKPWSKDINGSSVKGKFISYRNLFFVKKRNKTKQKNSFCVFLLGAIEILYLALINALNPSICYSFFFVKKRTQSHLSLHVPHNTSNSLKKLIYRVSK